VKRSESPYVRRTLARLEAEVARSPRRAVLWAGPTPPLGSSARAGLTLVVAALLAVSGLVGHVAADAIRAKATDARGP